MPRWTRNDDAWDDELGSDDGLEDADWSDEDDEPTEPCPYCGREIHEEARGVRTARTTSRPKTRRRRRNLGGWFSARWPACMPSIAGSSGTMVRGRDGNQAAIAH